MGSSKRISSGAGKSSAAPGVEPVDENYYKERLLDKQRRFGERATSFTERSSAIGEKIAGITGTTPEDVALKNRLTNRQEVLNDRARLSTTIKENIGDRIQSGEYRTGPKRMAGERMQKDAKLTTQDEINAYKFLTGSDKYSDRRGLWSEITDAVEKVKKTGKLYSEKDIARFISSVRNR